MSTNIRNFLFNESKSEKKQDHSYVSLKFLVYYSPGNPGIVVLLANSNCLKVDHCSLKTELMFVYFNVKSKYLHGMPCLESKLQGGKRKNAKKRWE